ncbi:MAG TPA: hypothetical protein VI636_09505 [Candidatus Angelobacter sp.]
MNPIRRYQLSLLVACVLCVPGMARNNGPSSSTSITPVPQAQLCVTEGKIVDLGDDKLSVSVPKMRAFVSRPAVQEVEAHFTYLGPTKESAPLTSGELRRQFGLKLRAQDGCNLVYAMWRIKPQQELVVSVKSNPGMTRSSQCDAHGYHTIKPTRSTTLPPVEQGKHYTLRAIIDGNQMQVYANNKLVWQGLLGAEALAFNGPVGVRTDNGRFDFELFAAEPQAGQQGASAACHAGNGDE